MSTKPKIPPKGAAKKEKTADDLKSEIDDSLKQEKQAEFDTSLIPDKPVGLPQTGDDEVFEEDFTDIDDEFPMATEGAHHAKVIDFEKSDSSKGNPQYVWQFRITSGQSKGIELRYWTSLLPQARWKAVETLVAVGIAAKGSVASFSRSDILGKPCIIDVIHDTFEERTNHKVKKVYPPNKDSIKYAKADDVPF